MLRGLVVALLVLASTAAAAPESEPPLVVGHSVRGRPIVAYELGDPTAPATLVVGTTYDPATPYRGAKRLVSELGNARLLTMRGDGHTAYGGNSPCIDSAVDAYLIDGTLPAKGTVCKQEVPFEPLPAPQAATLQLPRAPAAQVLRRPHVKPFIR